MTLPLFINGLGLYGASLCVLCGFFFLFNDHQRVWKICEACSIITPCITRRLPLLVKCLCYNSTPSSAGGTTVVRDWRFCFQLKKCIFQLVEKQEKSFPASSIDNRFVGPILRHLLIDCTEDTLREREPVVDWLLVLCTHPASLTVRGESLICLLGAGSQFVGCVIKTIQFTANTILEL